MFALSPPMPPAEKQRTMSPRDFSEPTACIVKFGPAGFDTDGFRPAEYYQVTIDPQWVAGEFIRFGQHHADEINGWQRIAAITVVHVLGPKVSPTDFKGDLGVDSVQFNALE